MCSCFSTCEWRQQKHGSEMRGRMQTSGAAGWRGGDRGELTCCVNPSTVRHPGSGVTLRGKRCVSEVSGSTHRDSSALVLLDPPGALEGVLLYVCIDQAVCHLQADTD